MAVEVGSAYVSIVPSAKGFASKLQGEIGSGMSSAGESSGKAYGGGLLAAAKSFAAPLAGLFAVSGAVSFLKDANSEARESQKVGALTEQVIKSTGGAAKVTADQVGDLATAISNKTGIDDEAVQSASNLLLTFTNVRNEVGAGNDVFNQATQAATDMGAALGGDPKDSAIQLGKALNDPVKGIMALQRVGVSFTEQQKEQVKAMVASGDTLGAQKMILGELNKEFGGAAAASATAGEKFKTTFANFKESIGTALLPALDSVLTKATEVLGGPKVMAGIDRLSKGVTGIIDLVSEGNLDGFGVIDETPALHALLSIRAAVKDMYAGFQEKNPNDLAEPLTGWAARGSEVAATIGAVKTGIKEMYDAFKGAPLKSGDELTKWSQAGHDLRTQLDLLVPKLRDLWGTAKDLWPTIKQIATQLGQASASLGVSTWQLFLLALDLIGSTLKTLAPTIKDLAAWLKDHQGVVVALVAAYTLWSATSKAIMVVQAAMRVASIAGAVATGVMTAAQWLLNAALTANPIGLVVVAIAALVAGLIFAYKNSETFRNIVDGVWTNIKIGALSMGLVVVQALRFMVDMFLGMVETLVTGAAKAFGWVPGLGPKLEEAAGQVAGFRDSANSSLGGIEDNLQVNLDTALAQKQADDVASYFRSRNFTAEIQIKANYNDILDARQESRDAIAGARAGGGPVASGSSYLVGERGPEIFTPSTSGTIIPNGAGTTTYQQPINIYGNIITPDPQSFEAEMYRRRRLESLGVGG